MGKLFYRSCGIFCTDAVNFWQGGRKSREKKGAGEAGYVYIIIGVYPWPEAGFFRFSRVTEKYFSR